ncbi:Protein F59D12.2 [Aphelenchoides avenae]|nr:Protein F59D12.2 [Aphelenchus avenae]
MSTATGDREVDLSQLFSDVSRTVSGLRNIIGRPQDHLLPGELGGGQTPQDGASAASGGMPSGTHSSASPFAGLFGGGGVCFKTCGMEDIQFAARASIFDFQWAERAGEMFLTMKWCLIIFTIASVICVLVVTTAVLLHLYRSHRSCSAQAGGPRMPFFSSLFVGRRNQDTGDGVRSKSSLSSGGGS